MALIGLALLAVPAAAQEGAQIWGQVALPSGHFVSGLTVYLQIDGMPPVQAVSDVQGRFGFRILPAALGRGATLGSAEYLFGTSRMRLGMRITLPATVRARQNIGFVYGTYVGTIATPSAAGPPFATAWRGNEYYEYHATRWVYQGRGFIKDGVYYYVGKSLLLPPGERTYAFDGRSWFVKNGNVWQRMVAPGGQRSLEQTMGENMAENFSILASLGSIHVNQTLINQTIR